MTRALRWVRARLGTALSALLSGLPWRQAAEPPLTAGLFTGLHVEDEPQALPANAVCFVGGRDPVYAVMTCPCGCGAPIRLNLRPEAEPRWRYTVQDSGAVTLSPSVWRREGCRSHFFVRHGRIEWCAA